MKKLTITLLVCILTFSAVQTIGQTNDRIVLGYFPSWSETWTTTNQNSSLREVPNFVNYIFLAFAKPNLEYISGSYDISATGIETPYDGCQLKESVSALKDKGINVILSIGGETYWGTPDAYNIDYQQIKDLVDDIGFAGIDWDYEPNGSFAEIGNPTNVQHYIDFFNNSRALMPESEGYILACAPSGVGALGGQINDDPNSLFAFANRNSLTGENDNNLYVNISIKKKDYNNSINHKFLENNLTELKDLYKENYQQENVMHMLIISCTINGQKYSSFKENSTGNNLCLEVNFISISNELASKLSKVLEKYQVKINQYMCGNYVKKFLDHDHSEFYLTAHKLKNGHNDNEVILVPKNIENMGFFEKFFQLFS